MDPQFKDLRFLMGFLGILFLLPVSMLFLVASVDGDAQKGFVKTERLGNEVIAFANANSALMPPPTATPLGRPVSFSQDIQPILDSRCVYCHGPNSINGSPPNGLQLDSYDNVMLGSLFLPVVQPGAPENSTIILLLRSGGMPAQSQPLPPDQIELVAKWIEEGALDN